MMDAFRGSKKIIAGIFVVLMLVFILTMVDLSAFQRAGDAGSINGEEVSAQTYDELVRQQIEQVQRSSSAPLSLEDVQAVRDQVWEQLVQSAVLEDEYERRGIDATDDELVAFIQGNPPPEVRQAPEFQTGGRFDLAKYQRWLGSASAQPVLPYLEAQARDAIKRMKLFRVVAADVFMSDAELWQHYRDQNETVSIGLTAIIPRNAVPDSAVPVTPAEVEAYYREHRAEFERPATAYMSYVALPRVITSADTAAARERAAQLRQEIVDGAPFGEVAQRESADTVSGSRGGELGWWTRGQMDPAFDSAAFALRLNTVSEPVLSSFGYHLIEVTARSGDSAQARHLLVPIDLSGERRDQLDAKADTLDRLAAEQLDPAALDSAARALGLTVRQAEPVQKGSRVLVGNYVVPDAGVWAFQAQEGEVSPIIETARALFVFRLDSTQAAGVPPLASIRPAVEAAARDARKWDEARKLAETYLKRVNEGSSLADAAKAMGFPHREFEAFTRTSPPLPNPAIVGAAFSLQDGQRSGVIDTPEGLYVIEVLKRTPADSAAFNRELDQLRADGIRTGRQQRIQSFLTALRREADVEDNRAELYRTNAAAAAAAANLPQQPRLF